MLRYWHPAEKKRKEKQTIITQKENERQKYQHSAMHSVTPKTPKPLFVQCNPILSLESCYAAPPLSLLPQHKPTCFCHLWLSSPRGLAANVEVDVALCWLRETCRGRRAVSYAVCVGVQFVWELGMWVVCGPCQGMWRKALGVIVILLL